MRIPKIVIPLLGVGLVLTVATPPAAAQAGKDKPITIGSDQGDLDALTDQEPPLQVTGFGVADYHYDGRTHVNSIAAGKLAVSLFRELSDAVWFFGQLTTSIDEGTQPPAGTDVNTATEIDNLLVSITPPGASNLNFTVGKFDVPIGFERDDEPLNLQPTQSFNYELARPSKMVGVVGRWTVSAHTDVTAWVSDGWDADLSSNHGKSGGARLGFLPSENASIGISALYGPEGNPGATLDRYLLTLDYAFQPGRHWIVAGEANLGGDRGALSGRGDGRWYGGTLTIFRRLSRHFGAVVRGDVFRDRDGLRTGTPQTLTSYTIAPLYILGVGREGIFANVEHTTFRIPRFTLRGEARLNHSTTPFFPTATGLDTWTVQYVLQTVVTF